MAIYFSSFEHIFFYIDFIFYKVKKPSYKLEDGFAILAKIIL